MEDTTVQEHVRHQLPDLEVAGQDEMKSEQVCQIDAIAFKDKLGEINKYVDDEQVLGDWRQLVHRLFFLSAAKLVQTSGKADEMPKEFRRNVQMRSLP